MIRGYAMIREAAAQVAAAADQTVEALRDGRIEDEPHFTGRMLGRIEQAMNGFESRGVRWSAKSLTFSGRGSQESRVGADFAGVLSIELPEYRVHKGFLAQAKRIEPGDPMDTRDWERMCGQCEDMLSLSPASFVLLYSVAGITIVPAVSVLAATRMNPHALYSRSAARFFEEHFSSFIGDRRISTPNFKTLEALAQEYRARSALHLKGAATKRLSNSPLDSTGQTGREAVDKRRRGRWTGTSGSNEPAGGSDADVRPKRM